MANLSDDSVKQVESPQGPNSMSQQTFTPTPNATPANHSPNPNGSVGKDHEGKTLTEEEERLIEEKRNEALDRQRKIKAARDLLTKRKEEARKIMEKKEEELNRKREEEKEDIQALQNMVEELARQKVSLVCEGLASYISDNKDDPNFAPAKLVGAMVFRGSTPSYNLIAEVMNEIGINTHAISSFNTLVRMRGVEVWAEDVNAVWYIKEIVLLKGEALGSKLKLLWSWKCYEWTDHWNINIRGCPPGWNGENVKKGLFVMAKLLMENLVKISRPQMGDGRRGATITLRYSKLPPEWIGWA
jgi:hypothetical protein